MQRMRHPLCLLLLCAAGVTSAEDANPGPEPGSKRSEVVLQLSTNDAILAEALNQMQRAEKIHNDFINLAGMMPPGSEPHNALQATLEKAQVEFKAREAVYRSLADSRLVLHGKQAKVRRAKLRAKWIGMLENDIELRGITLYGSVWGFTRLKISKTGPH